MAVFIVPRERLVKWHGTYWLTSTSYRHHSFILRTLEAIENLVWNQMLSAETCGCRLGRHTWIYLCILSHKIDCILLQFTVWVIFYVESKLLILTLNFLMKCINKHNVKWFFVSISVFVTNEMIVGTVRLQFMYDSSRCKFSLLHWYLKKDVVSLLACILPFIICYLITCLLLKDKHIANSLVFSHHFPKLESDWNDQLHQWFSCLNLYITCNASDLLSYC